MHYVVDLIERNHLYHVFQPLCRLPNQEKIGFEALCRSISGIGPDMLFQESMKQNQLFKLDTWSIEHAVSNFFFSPIAQKIEGFLFVNIFPSTIISDAFPVFINDIIRRFHPFIHRIVFEINESITEDPLWNHIEFIQGLKELRKERFLIAFDDVGEGSISFRKIVEISPDFIKIDRFFSKDLSDCKRKQKAIQLFVDYCNDADIKLILEGIENEEDCECASFLGVKIGQGYFLGKPKSLNDTIVEIV